MTQKPQTTKKTDTPNESEEKTAPVTAAKTDDRERVSSGMIVSVYEKIIDKTPKGEDRERVQVFKGMVLARKHGKEPGATITVRKQSDKVQVEKIFPVYSPLIERIAIEKKFKTRRAKLYFLRGSKKRLREVK